MHVPLVERSLCRRRLVLVVFREVTTITEAKRQRSSPERKLHEVEAAEM